MNWGSGWQVTWSHCKYFLSLDSILIIFLLHRCDADPNALAKYVLALIRKDKPIDDLKASMISQMDVFLQTETQSFVDMLFKIIDSKEYLAASQTKQEDVAAAVVKTETDLSRDDDNIDEAANNGDKAEADSTTPVRQFEKLPDPRPAYDDREDIEREERRRRSRPSPPRRGHWRRGGHDHHRDYQPRRFRSRSRSRTRSLSPRHDR